MPQSTEPRDSGKTQAQMPVQISQLFPENKSPSFEDKSHEMKDILLLKEMKIEPALANKILRWKEPGTILDKNQINDIQRLLQINGIDNLLLQMPSIPAIYHALDEKNPSEKADLRLERRDARRKELIAFLTQAKGDLNTFFTTLKTWNIDKKLIIKPMLDSVVEDSLRSGDNIDSATENMLRMLYMYYFFGDLNMLPESCGLKQAFGSISDSNEVVSGALDRSLIAEFFPKSFLLAAAIRQFVLKDLKKEEISDELQTQIVNGLAAAPLAEIYFHLQTALKDATPEQMYVGFFRISKINPELAKELSIYATNHEQLDEEHPTPYLLTLLKKKALENESEFKTWLFTLIEVSTHANILAAAIEDIKISFGDCHSLEEIDLQKNRLIQAVNNIKFDSLI